ncbi:MAG: response regulator, partial [Anaerolineae bacterium]
MGGQYVLTIEGDWRIRKVIRANLEAEGLTVREAVGGPHGLQMIGERRPDLILLDLDLPDADIWQLIAALQAVFANQPVPVIAMCAEPPGRQLLRHGGFVNYLQKPFAAPALLQQVQAALDARTTGSAR